VTFSTEHVERVQTAGSRLHESPIEV
jgi:hypothetical protein